MRVLYPIGALIVVIILSAYYGSRKHLRDTNRWYDTWFGKLELKFEGTWWGYIIVALMHVVLFLIIACVIMGLILLALKLFGQI